MCRCAIHCSVPVLFLSDSDACSVLYAIHTLSVFFGLRVRRFLSTRSARSLLDLAFDIALGAILVASKCAESRRCLDETALPVPLARFL